MLVLGRKPNEYIMIGDDIMVKVVEVGGDLRLAIDAPKNIRIMRGELYDRQKAQQAPSEENSLTQQ